MDLRLCQGGRENFSPDRPNTFTAVCAAGRARRGWYRFSSVRPCVRGPLGEARLLPSRPRRDLTSGSEPGPAEHACRDPRPAGYTAKNSHLSFNKCKLKFNLLTLRRRRDLTSGSGLVPMVSGFRSQPGRHMPAKFPDRKGRSRKNSQLSFNKCIFLSDSLIRSSGYGVLPTSVNRRR